MALALLSSEFPRYDTSMIIQILQQHAGDSVDRAKGFLFKLDHLMSLYPTYETTAVTEILLDNGGSIEKAKDLLGDHQGPAEAANNSESDSDIEGKFADLRRKFPGTDAALLRAVLVELGGSVEETMQTLELEEPASSSAAPPSYSAGPATHGSNSDELDGQLAILICTFPDVESDILHRALVENEVDAEKAGKYLKRIGYTPEG